MKLKIHIISQLFQETKHNFTFSFLLVRYKEGHCKIGNDMIQHSETNKRH